MLREPTTGVVPHYGEVVVPEAAGFAAYAWLTYLEGAIVDATFRRFEVGMAAVGSVVLASLALAKPDYDKLAKLANNENRVPSTFRYGRTVTRSRAQVLPLPVVLLPEVGEGYGTASGSRTLAVLPPGDGDERDACRTD